MLLTVFGAGVGRTGTYSLKLALEKLGFGPCFHMEELAKKMPEQLPLWNAALEGHADWQAIYHGYNSAVDWPTARFYRELHVAYPDAKFVLGYRDPRTWAESFSETIYKLISEPENAPPHFHDWLLMVRTLLTQNGVPMGTDVAGLEAAFVAHADSVRAAIPTDQLLVFEAREGWEPLCSFLGVTVPDEPFPRSNNRSEFWDLIDGVS